MRTLGWLINLGLVCILLKLTECTLVTNNLWIVEETLSFDEAEKRCKIQNGQFVGGLVELRDEQEWDEVQI